MSRISPRKASGNHPRNRTRYPFQSRSFLREFGLGFIFKWVRIIKSEILHALQVKCEIWKNLGSKFTYSPSSIFSLQFEQMMDSAIIGKSEIYFFEIKNSIKFINDTFLYIFSLR